MDRKQAAGQRLLAAPFDAGSTLEDRSRVRCRRNLRRSRLRRRAGRADLCAHHRHCPEDRLFAARRTNPPEGLDTDHGDVARARSRHRSGPCCRDAGETRKSASFNDRDGKPFVFQLARDQWAEALNSLGFREAMEGAGFAHLGVAMDSDEKRRRCWQDWVSCSRPAHVKTGWRGCAAATRVGADQHAAGSLCRSRRRCQPRSITSSTASASRCMARRGSSRKRRRRHRSGPRRAQ
jgi:hypothetical protein